MLVADTVMVSVVRVVTSLKTELARVLEAVMTMASGFLLSLMCIFSGVF